MPKLENTFITKADAERHLAHDDKLDETAESISKKNTDEEKVEVKMLKPQTIMSKLIGILVVQNERNKLVPIRFQTEWKMYIEFQKIY